MENELEIEIDKVRNHLLQSKPILYPTETVWGLGGFYDSDETTAYINKIKKREDGKPMSVLVSDIKMAKDLAVIDEKVESLLNIIWPGPYTVILNKKDSVTSMVSGTTNTVGLRVTSHTLLREMIFKLQKPLTTTSANPTGENEDGYAFDFKWLPSDVYQCKYLKKFEMSDEPSMIFSIDENYKIKILRINLKLKEKLDPILEAFGFEYLV